MTSWAALHPYLPDADRRGPYSFVCLRVSYKPIPLLYIILRPSYHVNARIKIAIT